MEKFDKTLVLTGSIVVAPAEDISGVWVGHCLDFDVISQGSDPHEAIEAVIEAVAVTVLDDLQAGLDPCDRRAPEEYWVDLAKVLKHGEQVRLSDVKGDCKLVIATQATFVFERKLKQNNDGFSQFNLPPETARINPQMAA
jgi:hypothetical protein